MERDPHDEPTETVVDGQRRNESKRRPSAESRPQPTMLGRYVVLGELGRGGMSVVYAAYDPELDRRVALKVVRADQLSETHRARLHREAQALARLSHPSVVTVFDVGDLANDTFVAMELVDGMSLREWMQAAADVARGRARGARRGPRARRRARRGHRPPRRQARQHHDRRRRAR